MIYSQTYYLYFQQLSTTCATNSQPKHPQKKGQRARLANLIQTQETAQVQRLYAVIVMIEGTPIVTAIIVVRGADR